jgi:hypothetical protein
MQSKAPPQLIHVLLISSLSSLLLLQRAQNNWKPINLSWKIQILNHKQKHYTLDNRASYIDKKSDQKT